MKDLQLRFGIVLLVIISVVSFMIGRSLRPVMDARAHAEVALEVPGSDAAPSAGEDGRKSLI